MLGEAKTTTIPLRKFISKLNTFVVFGVIACGVGLMSSPASDQALIGLPELEVGAIASQDLRSPIDITVRDTELESRLRHEAMSSVMPVLDFMAQPSVVLKKRINSAFSVFDKESNPASEAVNAERFMRQLGVFVEKNWYELLLKNKSDVKIRDAILLMVQLAHEKQIAEDKKLIEFQVKKGVRVRYLGIDGEAKHERTLTDFTSVLSVEEARLYMAKLSAQKLSHFSIELRRCITELSKKLVLVNFRPNEQETQRRIQAAGQSIQPVLIQIATGDLILSRGEEVSIRDKLILDSLVNWRSRESHLFKPIGSAAIIFFLLLALFVYFRSSISDFLPRRRDLALVTSVYLVTLLLLWTNYRLGTAYLQPKGPVTLSAIHFLVPVAFGAIVCRVMLGFTASASFLPLLAITAGWMMDLSLGYTIYTLMGALAGATVKTGRNPRRQLLAVGFWCGFWQAVTVGLLALHEQAITMERIQDIGAAFLSGLLSGGLALLLIPIFEVLFGHTSPLRLAQLSNLNHPLLRELLLQAPGSYHHSIVVGAMAEASAMKIGANPLLARVAGYFHDVGKLENPAVYSENQDLRGVSAVHDAPDHEVIGRHVEKSLELGKTFRLGADVLEIISQHHGNQIVTANQDWNLEESSLLPRVRSELRYNGPKPNVREAGLVMLADAVESALRNRSKEQMIDLSEIEIVTSQVISETVASGQLDHCPLSLADLFAISGGFVEVLAKQFPNVIEQQNVRYIDDFKSRQEIG